jgi:hypothetical protein
MLNSNFSKLWTFKLLLKVSPLIFMVLPESLRIKTIQEQLSAQWIKSPRETTACFPEDRQEQNHNTWQRNNQAVWPVNCDSESTSGQFFNLSKKNE